MKNGCIFPLTLCVKRKVLGAYMVQKSLIY